MFLLVPLMLMLVLGAAVGWALRPVRTTAPTTPSQAWIAAERHARRVVAVAWIVLVLVPAQILIGFFGGYRMVQPAGPVQAALPLVGGLAFLAVGAVGELTWPRPIGDVRRAGLSRRRVRDIAPRGLSVLTATWATLLAALLIVSGAAAGTGGRSLSFQNGEVVRTTSPFPGWYYGRPVAIALVLVLTACLGVLVLIARRPPVSETAPHADAALRRTSCRRVLAGVQLVLAWTFAGCLFFVGSALSGVEPRWADAFGPGTSVLVGHLLSYVSLAIPIVSAVVAVAASRAPVTSSALGQGTGLVTA
ncbi:hypothetical protein ACPPVS_15065 [Cellulomonas sp. McL0617]|uniref:hypothetical protein n=1 Tax=Cellulomonas sp. McL0617 TaxID=3415675 RepID=UPI003CFAC85D